MSPGSPDSFRRGGVFGDGLLPDGPQVDGFMFYRYQAAFMRKSLMAPAGGPLPKASGGGI